MGVDQGGVDIRMPGHLLGLLQSGAAQECQGDRRVPEAVGREPVALQTDLSIQGILLISPIIGPSSKTIAPLWVILAFLHWKPADPAGNHRDFPLAPGDFFGVLLTESNFHSLRYQEFTKSFHI